MPYTALSKTRSKPADGALGRVGEHVAKRLLKPQEYQSAQLTSEHNVSSATKRALSKGALVSKMLTKDPFLNVHKKPTTALHENTQAKSQH